MEINEERKIKNTIKTLSKNRKPRKKTTMGKYFKIMKDMKKKQNKLRSEI